MLSFLVTAWRVLKSLMNDRGWADRDLLALWSKFRNKPDNTKQIKTAMQPALEIYLSIRALVGFYEEALREWGMGEFFHVIYKTEEVGRKNLSVVQVLHTKTLSVVWSVEVVSANSFVLIPEPESNPVMAVGDVHTFKFGSRGLVEKAVAKFMVSKGG